MAADIADALKNWSTSEALNSPSGATPIGTGLDQNLRMLQTVVRQDLANKGSDVATAATTDLGAVPGSYHDLTGATTVTGFGTVSAGISKVLQFDSTPVLKHNASSLILPGGADIKADAGDHLVAVSLGSGNWVVPFFMKGNTPPAPTIGQNSQSTAYTTVLSDAGKSLIHPSTDNNARTFTIDSNASVPYPIGTPLTFVNQINTLTIAITSDTLTLAGANTTGTRTLAAGGIATALKMSATGWLISGTGLS